MFLKYDEFGGHGMGPGRFKSNVLYRMHYLKYKEIVTPGSFSGILDFGRHPREYNEKDLKILDCKAFMREYYFNYNEFLPIDLRFNELNYKREGAWRPLNGKFEYYIGYSSSCVALDPTAKIQDYPCERRTRGKKLIPGSVADCICDSKEHLENWKYYIFHNKLPLFLNIVLTYSLNNNVKNFMPYLVDKHYTDEEISEMFGFTSDELEFIDYILYKYERHSPWFKRYMLGEQAVSKEEIENYLHKQ